MFYVENCKEFTKKLLELTSDYSKVTKYNINIKKPITFLYTNNEQYEKDIKKAVLFIIASKRIKYPGTYVAKKVKDFYPETWKNIAEKKLKKA